MSKIFYKKYVGFFVCVGFFLVFRIKFFGVVTNFFIMVYHVHHKLDYKQLGSLTDRKKNSHYKCYMYKSTYVYLYVDSTDVYHVHIMVIFLKHRHIASLVVL